MTTSLAGKSTLDTTEEDLIRHQFSLEPSSWPHRWGWVVYRTAYAPELDAGWTALKERIRSAMSAHADSDAEVLALSPEVREKQDFVFVEEAHPRELEAMSADTLRTERFQAWARAEAPDVDTFAFRGARYGYFLLADEEVLRSVLGMPSVADGTVRFPPFVNIVQGWPDDDIEPEYEEEQEETQDGSGDNWDDGPMDRTRLALDGLVVSDYTELNADENWYNVVRSAGVRCAPIRT